MIIRAKVVLETIVVIDDTGFNGNIPTLKDRIIELAETQAAFRIISCDERPDIVDKD